MFRMSPPRDGPRPRGRSPAGCDAGASCPCNGETNIEVVGNTALRTAIAVTPIHRLEQFMNDVLLCDTGKINRQIRSSRLRFVHRFGDGARIQGFTCTASPV
jgi:hypothetical protein